MVAVVALKKAPEGAAATIRIAKVPKVGKPVAPAPRVVVVQSGETLTAIARREYGDAKAWRAIHAANKEVLEDPNRIRPGMKLVIRALASPGSPKARTYAVKKGDTLYSIAKAAYGDGRKWDVLYEANRKPLELRSIRGIRPDMVLSIPKLAGPRVANE